MRVIKMSDALIRQRVREAIEFILGRSLSLVHRRRLRRRLERIRCLSGDALLRQFRGALLDCSRHDIMAAYNRGLFCERSMLDSAVRVIKRLGWFGEPVMEPLVNERCKYSRDMITSA